MSKHSFVLVAALATQLIHSQPASAQKAPAKPTPAPSVSSAARAEALTANMTQALGLTPAQQEKVRVINANSVRNVETARQRYVQEPAKLRGYIDDVSLARLDQLKDVLTPAQFARYQQKREEKMGATRARRRPAYPATGATTNLPKRWVSALGGLQLHGA
jgi:hypothetical protein